MVKTKIFYVLYYKNLNHSNNIQIQIKDKQDLPMKGDFSLPRLAKRKATNKIEIASSILSNLLIYFKNYFRMQNFIFVPKLS
jgi:hypothetical protein